MALNRARVALDIQLTADLNYSVQIDYFDIADPLVVIVTEAFVVPLNATVGQLQAQVVARGQALRSAYASLAAARVAVPNQTVVTVP